MKALPSPHLPPAAFFVIEGVAPPLSVGMILLGEKGYHVVSSPFTEAIETQDQAKVAVLALNRVLGATPLHVECMKVGSSFGWHVLAADPARYTVERIAEIEAQA